MKGGFQGDTAKNAAPVRSCFPKRQPPIAGERGYPATGRFGWKEPGCRAEQNSASSWQLASSVDVHFSVGFSSHMDGFVRSSQLIDEKSRTQLDCVLLFVMEATGCAGERHYSMAASARPVGNQMDISKGKPCTFMP